jgi:hypothetical protein
VFTILILVLGLASFGQTLSDIGSRLKLLENRSDFVYDTAGFSVLPKIDFFCDNGNQNPWDYYHVIDLNGDGLNDLVYSGPCKPEGQTGIFLNTSQGFKKLFNYPGELVHIDQSKSTKVVHIFRTACCCNFYSEYIAVSIDSLSNVSKNIISFGADTNVKIGTRLRKQKVVGVLRTTPEVNDLLKKDPCGKQSIKGNHVARIQNFKDVIQLSKSGSWWLVLFPLNKERSLIGWMKINN